MSQDPEEQPIVFRQVTPEEFCAVYTRAVAEGADLGTTNLRRLKPKTNPIAVKLGKAEGLARAKALTPEQRSAIARKGGIARMRGSTS